MDKLWSATKKDEDFSAEEFVKNLLNEGCKLPCDETSDAFNNNLNIPPFFDEALFKKGQAFYKKYLCSLFIGKFLGLISLLTIHLPMKILVLTNMSSTEMTAYKRYLATILHMCLWYEEDFRPGSRSWNSIITVRRLHNSASKRSNRCLHYGIKQADMAFAQFGFMGLAIARSKMIGLHSNSEEELKAFINLWRTVGYVLGVEDRFNICRASVKETKEICNLLIDKVFLPNLRNPPDEFESMSHALVNGLQAVNPIFDPHVMKLYLEMTLEDSKDFYTKSAFKKWEWLKKSKWFCLWYTVWSMQYTFLRIFHNHMQILSLWILRNFPFFAYYKYGKINSHVVVE